MKKELFTQLRKNGFPKTECWSDECCTPTFYWQHVPSLEKLIEACGEDLDSLTRHANIWQTNWRDGFAGETAGITPEEAVARLWLKLNQK